MRTLKTITLSVFALFCTFPVLADQCCVKMGGASYCDSSSGRLVCNNGFYSACYCTRHSVMDLQLLKGCCLWQGGILKSNERVDVVLCNDGSVSEECSIMNAENLSNVF